MRNADRPAGFLLAGSGPEREGARRDAPISSDPTSSGRGAVLAKLCIALFATLTLASPATGAQISWGDVDDTTAPDVSDVLDTGVFVEAINYGPASGTLEVNGVVFTNQAADVGTFWAGGPVSGDPDYDEIFDGAQVLDFGPGVTGTLTLTNLTVGQTYRVQLFNIHDRRPCCGDRVYELDDESADFANAPRMKRSTGGNIVGTFIADATSQQVLYRSLGGNENNDPALAAYVLAELPTTRPARVLVRDDFDQQAAGEGWVIGSTWGGDSFLSTVSPQYRRESRTALGRTGSGTVARSFDAATAAALDGANELWLGIAFKPSSGPPGSQSGLAVGAPGTVAFFLQWSGSLGWRVITDTTAYSIPVPGSPTAWTTFQFGFDFGAGKTTVFADGAEVLTIPEAPPRNWDDVSFLDFAGGARWENLRIGESRDAVDPMLDALGDRDGDRLSNATERALGTDPGVTDTDGDGLDDFEEIRPTCLNFPIQGPSCLFQDRTTVFAGGGASQLFASDFDLDGKTDIASTTATGVWIRYDFATRQDVFVPTTDHELAVGDINGDGYPDFVAASSSTGAIRWYRSDPTASGLLGRDFNPVLITSTQFETTTNGGAGVALADLDGDGDLDVVTATEGDVPNGSSQGYITWWENDGSGAFSLRSALDLPGDRSDPIPVVVRVGDLDGDGSQDVVVANSSGVSIGRAQAGEFTPIQLVPIFTEVLPDIQTLELGDIDADGDLDIVVLSQNATISLLENTGVGCCGFLTRTTLYEDASILAAVAIGDLNRRLADIKLDDVDADGDVDIAVAQQNVQGNGDDADLFWLRNLDTSENFGGKDTLATGLANVLAALVADFDHDGLLDVLGGEAGTSGDVAAYRQKTRDFNVLNASNVTTLDPTLSDFDGDGLLDGFEVENGLDPVSNIFPLTVGEATEDLDGDGLNGLAEQALGTNVNTGDTDRDGLGDETELVSVTDPVLGDTDGDGLCDGGIPGASTEGSATACPIGGEDTNANGLYDEGIEPDPVVADTDSDTLLDGFEVANGLDPLVPDDASLDVDEDGLTYLEEQGAGTDPNRRDTDLDGLDDGFEVDLSLDPTLFDSDGDRMSDGYEVENALAPLDPTDASLDPDNDTVSNLREALARTGAQVPDTDGDGLRDDAELELEGAGALGTLEATPTGVFEAFAVDIDGDGDEDLVWGRPESRSVDRVAWQENLDREGTFGPPVEIRTTEVDSSELMAMAVGDVDGDNDVDVIAAYESQNFDPPVPLTIVIEWYENLDGKGQFGSPRIVPTSIDDPEAIRVGDVDGDGDADLVVASGSDDNVVFFDNLGGSGTAWQQNLLTNPGMGATGDVDNPFDVAIADLNGDGHQDLVSLSAADGTLVWLRGLPTSQTTIDFYSFEPAAVLASVASTPQAVATGDLDGDGDTDVVLARIGFVSWFENDGVGNLTLADDLGDGNAFAPILVEDVDLDGDLDIVSGGLFLFENVDGNGTFASSAIGAPSEPTGTNQIVAANFAGELFASVLMAPQGSGFSDTSASPFKLELIPMLSFSNPHSIDTDGDRLVDSLEVANSTFVRDADSDLDDYIDGAEIAGLSNPLNGSEQPSTPSTRIVSGAADPFDGLVGGLTSSYPFLADIDGDEDLDLVAGDFSAGYEVVLFLNIGTPFAPEFAAQIPSAFTGLTTQIQAQEAGLTFAYAIALADLDADADLDLMVGGDQGRFYYFENTGDARGPEFTARIGSSNPMDGLDFGNKSYPAFGDIDGDGDFDLFSGASSGEILYFENTGTPSSPVFVNRTGSGNPADGFSVTCNSTVALEDFDGDRDLDLVVGNLSCGDPLIYLENIGSESVPTFVARSGSASPFPESTIFLKNPTLGDLTADGAPDLLLGGLTGGSGNPLFEYRESIPRDTDGDSIPDFLDPDDDGDGLFDTFELTWGFDPLFDGGEATADGDGDGLDNLGEQAADTNPENPDSDGDGASDGDEVAAATDPNDEFVLPVVIALDYVGDPGNADDVTGFGGVDYLYAIGTFEVTNRQYAAYLNAVADEDANSLWIPAGNPIYEIVRVGASPNYRYEVVAGAADEPINFLSVWEAMRFVNWLENGQPVGPQGPATTEDGTYTLTPALIAGNAPSRNPGSTWWLPLEDEWYKAAYYDTATQTYFESPAGTPAAVTCNPSQPMANCEGWYGGPTPVGDFAGFPSPNGTFDQGGNVWEWTETKDGANRRIRGGSYLSLSGDLEASNSGQSVPPAGSGGIDDLDRGFRVAPEPGFGVLIAAGMGALGSLARSRRRAREQGGAREADNGPRGLVD